MPCVQQASYLGEGPLMWILPLYLHINKKSDDDDEIMFSKIQILTQVCYCQSFYASHMSCFFYESSFLYQGLSKEQKSRKKKKKKKTQKLTQLSSRSHPRHLVGKRTAQKRHHHRHHKRQPGEQQFPIQ